MDLVMMGGNVLTMDGHNSRSEALAVEGGRIKAVGANAEIEKLIGEKTRVVHLAGRTLLPGFIDPHNHFSINMLEPVAVDCSAPPLDSVGSVLEAISAAAKGTPKGRWVRGWGLRTARLKEERAVTRWELDESAPRALSGRIAQCTLETVRCPVRSHQCSGSSSAFLRVFCIFCIVAVLATNSGSAATCIKKDLQHNKIWHLAFFASRKKWYALEVSQWIW